MLIGIDLGTTFSAVAHVNNESKAEVIVNRDGDLPTVDNEGNVISYREHDVNDCIDGERRDSERFVTGSDGSVYYTDDHYRSFSRIIGE